MDHSFSSPQIVGVLHTPACLKKLEANETALPRTGIDLLEVRLDAFPHRLPITRKWPLPVIATARDSKEGGLNKLSLKQRRQSLEAALTWASIIDIELQNAKAFSTTIARARGAQCLTIFSHHDFQKTPSLRELQDLVARAHNAGATIFKIATMTQSEEELKRLLEFQQLSHPLPVATMGMGAFGKKSRQLLSRAGSALAYGYLYQPLNFAPTSNQWSAQELTKIIQRGRRVLSML